MLNPAGTTPRLPSAVCVPPDPGEYIVYALPGGRLGRGIDDYFARARTICSRNAALAYPPHCTVTGFFHDDPGMLGHHVLAVDAAVATARRAGTTAIEVTRLRTEGPWIGLELDAPWLSSLACEVRDTVSSSTLDGIRPKDWLHVSLAYDFPARCEAALAELAADLLDQRLDARWELALFERTASGWHTHARWTL